MLKKHIISIAMSVLFIGLIPVALASNDTVTQYQYGTIENSDVTVTVKDSENTVLKSPVPSGSYVTIVSNDITKDYYLKITEEVSAFVSKYTPPIVTETSENQKQSFSFQLPIAQDLTGNQKGSDQIKFGVIERKDAYKTITCDSSLIDLYVNDTKLTGNDNSLPQSLPYKEVTIVFKNPVVNLTKMVVNDADNNNTKLYDVAINSKVDSNTGKTVYYGTFIMPDCNTSIVITIPEYFYGIYVDGNEITSKALAGSCGENGSYEYDPNTKILYLENATLSKTFTMPNNNSKNSECSIYFSDLNEYTKGNVTIQVKGDSVISPASVPSSSNYYGIFAGGNTVTITGDQLEFLLPTQTASVIMADTVNINNKTTIKNSGNLTNVSGITANILNITSTDSSKAELIENFTAENDFTVGEICGISKYSTDKTTLSVSQNSILNVNIKNAAKAIGIDSCDAITNSGNINISIEGTSAENSVGAYVNKINLSGVMTVDSGSAASGKTSTALVFDDSVEKTDENANICVSSGYIQAIGGTNAVSVLSSTEDNTKIPTIKDNSGVVCTNWTDDTFSSVSLTDTAIGTTKRLEIHHVNGNTLSCNSTVYVGNTIKAAATVSYDSALGSPITDESVTWNSSNPEIATISTDGTITGVAEGETTITATPIYDSNTAYIKTAKVTVEVAPSPSPSPTVDTTQSDTVSPSPSADTTPTDTTLQENTETLSPTITIDEVSVQLIKGNTESATVAITLNDLTADKLAFTVEPATQSVSDNITLNGNAITVKWTDSVSTVPTIKVYDTENEQVYDSFKVYFIDFDAVKINKVTTATPTFKDLAAGSYAQVSIEAPTGYEDYFKSKISWYTDNSGVASVNAKTDDKCYAFITPVKSGIGVIRAAIIDNQGKVHAYTDFTVTVSLESSYTYTYPTLNNSLIYFYDSSQTQNILFRTNIPASLVSQYGVELSNGTTSYNVPAKYLSVSGDSTYSEIVISGNWMSSTLPKKDIKYQLNTYFASNKCITRPIYVRSIYSSPVTGDENMEIYYGLIALSGLMIIGVCLSLKKNKKNCNIDGKK